MLKRTQQRHMIVRASDRRCDRINVMLQIYAIERQHQQTILQLIAALVTILATYVLASAGLTLHDCGQHLAVGSGCKAVPTPVGWLAPAPGIALLSFFTTMRVLYAASVGYTRGLEHDIIREETALGIRPVRMPRTLVGETPSFVKRLPSVAFGFTYVLSAIYVIVVELYILNWTSVPAGLVSVLVGALYVGIVAVCAVSRPLVLRKTVEAYFHGLDPTASGSQPA